MLHAFLHPKVHKRDVRHQDGRSVIDLEEMNFSKARANQTFGLHDPALRMAELYHHPEDLSQMFSLPSAYEKCGVSHFAHGWTPQGHAVSLSSSFRRLEN